MILRMLVVAPDWNQVVFITARNMYYRDDVTQQTVPCFATDAIHMHTALRTDR